MVLNDFNNIRLEYSVGATVIMFSLIDVSSNKSVLTPNNVSKIIIEYDFNDNVIYTREQGLSFHCNSWIVILSDLQENSDINFRVFISYEENGLEQYKIALTDIIHEHTLQLGNLTYTITDSDSLQENIVTQLTSVMDTILSYINNLGTYVDESFDDYAPFAKNIPVEYNPNIATADAQYYKYYSTVFGRVRTSGGSYFKNDVMYHELRHRYGINHIGTILSRDDTGNNSTLYNFVEDKFIVLHNALKFESGRDDAKVWIFDSHSNILEGNYTNEGDYNYLAANYIKALVWYTCHTTLDPDTSKVRIIAPINLSLITGEVETNDDIYYNITFNVTNGVGDIDYFKAKAGEIITISNIIPNEGYRYIGTSWSVSVEEIDGGVANENGIVESLRFKMPNSDLIINCVCEIINEQDDTLYNITLHELPGRCALSKQTAKGGEEIIISEIELDDGYKLSNIYVKYDNITISGVFEQSKTRFKFIMPYHDCDVYFICKQKDQIIDDNIISKNNTDINVNTKLKTIFLGQYQYLYEYLKNTEDFNDITCNDKFVILRNFEIVNNIIYDKDIFFVEKSIYDKVIDGLGDDLIVYPIYNNGNLIFGKNHKFFASYNINLKDMSYEIYNEVGDNTVTKANILCDKLRIYNPTINKNLDFIVYIDNYINNIHFHYFCNTNKNLNKKYTGEIKVNNSRYIEYIEINIPNIKKLFSEQNKYFIYEDFNKIIFEKDFSLKEYFAKTIKEYDNKLYLSKIIKPFIIDKVNENNKTVWIKTYIDDKYFRYNNNFINTSLNITIYPYEYILNNLYIMHNSISSTSTFIEYESYFRLSSRLGFDNGIISLINEFEFPGKIKTNKNGQFEYGEYLNPFDGYKEGDGKILQDRQVTEYYNTYYLNENIINLEEFDEDELDDEVNVETIRSTGFVIQFATDINFTDIVLESVINTDQQNNENFIYDFSFSLNKLVESWNQLNEILIARARFIDKRLNIVITGNNVVINKEFFKYFINDTLDFNIIFNKTNNLITNKFMDINQGFNFIDTINCTIKENDDIEKNNISISNNNIVNTKLVYKPIFYKVQDLQNIKIRRGMTQKIGVNLSEFMNTVNTFIINIGDQTINEHSRNDIYVIFEINANNIENNSGYYNIMNEDFEYISSGNYTIY